MDFDHVYDSNKKRVYRFVERLQGDERTRAEALVRSSITVERTSMGLGTVGEEHPTLLWCGHPRAALVESSGGVYCGMCP